MFQRLLCAMDGSEHSLRAANHAAALAARFGASLSFLTVTKEIKVTDDRFPFERLERAGYGAVGKGQKSWHGVAILARDAEPVVTRTNSEMHVGSKPLPAEMPVQGQRLLNAYRTPRKPVDQPGERYPGGRRNV